jgi:myo-inositol-1(or 4)-monophosphatase
VPFFGTSIAVAGEEEVGSIRLGYVLNLVNGDEFWAEKGGGAFLNGQRIRTPEDDVLKLVAFEAQSPQTELRKLLPLLEAARKTRCFGAIALDLAYLAGGSISVLANSAPSRSFDYAAGYLLVKEAGGIFTDFSGSPIEGEKLSLKRGASLLASGNRALHERALRLLHG